MNAEEIRTICLSKKGVTESFPFDNETLVFKVMNKIFLLIGLNYSPLSFNAKCDPEEAITLRESYPNVIKPGYHMSKVHWNTIVCDGELNHNQITKLIDDSYQLIVLSLPKKVQGELGTK
jgi:predicted DNA-binding protein (MmcQ/YjbR family)